MTIDHREAENNAQALLKFALGNHNAKRYREAAGFYEVLIKRYPDTEAAQYAQTNLSSLVNKIDRLESIQPDEKLIVRIEQQSNSSESVESSASPLAIETPESLSTVPKKIKKDKYSTAIYFVAAIIIIIIITTIGGGGLYYKKSSNIIEAKKSLIDVLKNPDTVKFRNEVSFKTPGVICGEFNAQNSMGGYVGFKKYIAKSKFFLIEDEDVLSWDPIEIENILGINVSAVQSIQSELGKEDINRDLLGILWKKYCEN